MMIALFCVAVFSAASGTTPGPPFVGHSYHLQATVLLNEPPPRTGKTVGFQVTSRLAIGKVWQHGGHILLKARLSEIGVHIKSRRAPSPEGFIQHTSQLDRMLNLPFLVHWTSGKVSAIYVDEKESRAILNLKKGVASLLQFQMQDQETEETDASGICTAQYRTTDGYIVQKIKTKCTPGKKLPHFKHPDQVWEHGGGYVLCPQTNANQFKLDAYAHCNTRFESSDPHQIKTCNVDMHIWGVNVNSSRNSWYEFSEDGQILENVKAEESHEMRLNIRQEAAAAMYTTQSMARIQDVPVTEKFVKGENMEAAVKNIEKTLGITYAKLSLVTDMEPPFCEEEGNCPSVIELVKSSRENLKDEHFGTVRSASALLRLVPAVRKATKQELVKVLKAPANMAIVPQLLDLFGASHTIAAHAAVLQTLSLNTDSNAERYFWALSFGGHSDTKILQDILRVKRTKLNEKLSETVMLTLAAMTNRFRKLLKNHSHKLVDEVRDDLVGGLNNCSTSDEICFDVHLRSLKNLALPNTMQDVVRLAVNGSRKTSVSAMKVLHWFPAADWDASVTKTAKQVYYQVGRQYDSSARTIALDILLKGSPTEDTIRHLVLSLTLPDHAYEVKQYLLQRLTQVAQANATLRETLRKVLAESGNNNYHVLAQRGMSTAFTRSFSEMGQLSTIQEINGGIVKRGLVDVLMDSHSIFTLGLFAGGLSSFISSDDGPSSEPEESANAGLELTVLGVQLRPFFFFTGQGELMGHVWSGTASDPTPALQVIALPMEFEQQIPLGCGLTAEFSLLGAVSFDLSGQIQLSLWNRNAQSEVNKNGGVSVRGAIHVNSQFVRSSIEFKLATELRLILDSNIDFSNNIALCLQLRQPHTTLRHSVFKTEHIPGSKHKLRKAKHKTIHIPGRTYALNQKNNEMCNLIYAN